MFLLSQIIGVIATLFSCVAIYNSKNRKLFYLFETIFCTLYALSLALVSAWTGMLLMVIGTIRMITFFVLEKKKINKPVYLIFIFQFITLITTIFTLSHWSSYLLLAVAMIYVWAIWQEKQMPLLVVTFIYSICNMLYNFYSSAYTCILLESIVCISTLITILKTLILKRTKQPKD